MKSRLSLAALDLEADRAYFLAAQTTQDRAIFQQAREHLRTRLGRSILTLYTICDATRDRQQEVIALAGKVRAMVVVGDPAGLSVQDAANGEVESAVNSPRTATRWSYSWT